MMIRRAWTGPIVALLAASCGGGQPQPSSPPRDPVPSPTAPGEVTPSEQGAVVAAPDLSPVARPEGVVLLGRIRDPGALADAALGWGKVGFDWRARLGRKIPGMDRAIHTSAPAELVARVAPGAPLDRAFELAFSVGLRDARAFVDGIRGAGESVEEAGPGSWRFADADLHCAVAPAVGPATSRVVCAHGEGALDALLPYATRGLPQENLGATDVHVELLGPPLQAAAGPELRRMRSLGVGFLMNELSTDSPALDGPLGDIVQGLADELILLVDDFEKLTVDLALADGGLRATVGLDLRGKTSWTAGTLGAYSARQSPPPELFYRLPADVTDASWSAGGVPERTAPLRRAVGRLLEGAAAHAKLPPALGQRASALAGELWESNALAFATVATAEPSGRAPAELGELTKLVGVRILGVAAPPDRYRRFIEKLVALYQDPALRKAGEKHGAKAGDLPKVTKRASKLVKGATVWEVSAQPKQPKQRKGKPAKAVSVLTVMLAPDGERTWLALGVEEEAVAKVVRDIIGGSSALRARPGILAGSAAPGIAGGFLTLAGVGPGGKLTGERADLPRILAGLPHRGQTPIPYVVRVEPRGAGVRLEEVITLPADAATDLGVLVRELAEDERRGETTAAR